LFKDWLRFVGYSLAAVSSVLDLAFCAVV
jgi:hypothetical protein